MAALTKSPASDSAEGDQEAILHSHSQSLLEWQSLCLKSIISAEGPWCRGSQDSSQQPKPVVPRPWPTSEHHPEARAGSDSRGSVKPRFSCGDQDVAGGCMRKGLCCDCHRGEDLPALFLKSAVRLTHTHHHTCMLLLLKSCMGR